MRITITQKELFKIVKEHFNLRDYELKNMNIQLQLKNGTKDLIYMFDNNIYNIGSFIKDDIIKGE